MTAATAILLGALGAALLTALAARQRSPAPLEREQPLAARELRGLRDDLRSGDIDRDEYERSREQLAAHLAATTAEKPEARARTLPAWRWPLAGVLAAAVIAIALVPAARQRSAAGSLTGNDFSGQTAAVRQAVQDVLAAERAMDRKDASTAVRRYRGALAVFPERTDLRARFGLALLQAGRPAESLTQLRLSLRRAPQNPQISLYLGAALVVTGQRKEAAVQWRRYLALAPPGPGTQSVRVQLRRLLKATPRSGAARRGRRPSRAGG